MLLEEIKPLINVTWNYEDYYIQTLINDGKGVINGLMGIELDYERDHEASSLLKDYVRYAYNKASEYFETNFADKIFRLQIKYAL